MNSNVEVGDVSMSPFVEKDIVGFEISANELRVRRDDNNKGARLRTCELCVYREGK